MNLKSVLLAAGLASGSALADSSGIEIRGLWVREGPPAAGVLAGYLELENRGRVPVRLAAVSSPDFARVEVHRTVVEGGVARMQRQDRLTIPVQGVVRMAPGGLHLMLMQPNRPLRAGDVVQLRFTFDPLGERLARGVVRRPAQGPADGGDGQHDHGQRGSAGTDHRPPP